MAVGKEKFFKVWRLHGVLQVTAWVLVVAFVGGVVWCVNRWYHTSLVTVGQIGWTVFWTVLGIVVGKTLIKLVRYRETATRFVTGLGLLTFGWAAAYLHLLIFEKIYLSLGRIKRQASPPEKPLGPAKSYKTPKPTIEAA